MSRSTLAFQLVVGALHRVGVTWTPNVDRSKRRERLFLPSNAVAETAARRRRRLAGRSARGCSDQCYGYSIDSTTYYRLWLLWQFILVIQTAMRAFVAWHRRWAIRLAADLFRWPVGVRQAPCPVSTGLERCKCGDQNEADHYRLWQVESSG